MVKILARHDLVGKDKVLDWVVDAGRKVFGSARFNLVERERHCGLELHEKIYARNYEREPIRSKPGCQSADFHT
jgi:hypothetical protein